LEVLDRKWREHLYEMDYLQEGIQLRGYGQRDPLIEYQREAFDMFTAMMDGIKEEAVGFLYYVQVNVEELAAVEEPTAAQEAVSIRGGGAEGGAERVPALAKTPRPPQSPLESTPVESAPPTPTPAPAPSVQATAESDRQKVDDVIGRALGLPSHK